MARRLAAYWQARDRFIESGRNVHPSSDVHDMLAQVREPLLSVLRISPDFRPAYDPLRAHGERLARTDARDARALLTELARMQPREPKRARAARARALGLTAPLLTKVSLELHGRNRHCRAIACRRTADLFQTREQASMNLRFHARTR